MRVIGLAVVVAFGFALVPVEAHTQQAGMVYRVGYLFEGSANAVMHASLGTGLDGLRQGLRTLGWTEGENLVIQARFAEGKPAERSPTRARERKNPELRLTPA
jgi:hypothetical protein